MRRTRALAVFFLAVVAATPALAQSVYSGCVQHDDPNCRARRERHQLGTYGVPSVDQLARDGVEARRLFVLDAHYADRGLIAFSRDHGGTPRLSLQPPGYGLSRAPPLSIAVPLPLWEEVRAESDAFHRGQRMAVAAPGDVCADAWTYILETANPASASSAVRIVDQCSGPQHPAWLAERALGLFPACAPLTGHAGTHYDALMLCATLRAESAAVETWVALAPMFERGNRDAVAVRAAFAPDAAIIWDGGPESGGAPADRWLREMQARDATLSFERIEALAGGRARLTGYIDFTQRQGRDEGRDYRARAVLELARDAAGRLRIVSARIGRYHRA
jgi:hypothetical protein